MRNKRQTQTVAVLFLILIVFISGMRMTFGNVRPVTDKLIGFSQATYNLVVYVTTYCPYCHEVMNRLDAKGIKYTAKYIDKDPAARRELIGKGYEPIIPQAFLNGKYVGKTQDILKLIDSGKLK